MDQEEANAYWATRPFKKFVVTLERGPKRNPQREVKYVGARSSSGAIACARSNAFVVKSPSRVFCRLATAPRSWLRRSDPRHATAIEGYGMAWGVRAYRYQQRKEMK